MRGGCRWLSGHYGRRFRLRCARHTARWSFLPHIRHEMNKRKTNARPLEQQVKNIKLHLLTGLKPAPPLPSFRKLFSGLLLLFGSVVLGSIILLDGRGWHALTTPTQFTILAPLILGACSVTLVVVRSTFAERNDNRNAVACSVVLLVLSIAAVLHTFEPQCEGQFLNVGVRCLGAGLLHALIATAALLAVIRRGAVLRPVLTSSAIRALAGLVAVAGSEIRCPNPNELHSLTWHLSLPVIGVVGGMIAGFYIDSCGGRNSRAPRSEVMVRAVSR